MNENKDMNKISDKKTISFIDQVYDEISSVIGVNGKNQFLCLQIPGTILNADDYRYDCSSNASKPLIVEANESRLANKMFDPCKITESDNGLSLPYLYESALNTLTPKLNKQVTELKNQLRQLLLSEYPYDFGDGIETKYTLQQVYFKLYDDYISALNEWSKIKNNKKEELRKKYPIKSDYNEAYIEWHETEAERYLSAIDEKKSKVLAVFSPNDMKILEGVLDSGTGAELQEARSALKKARKLTPSGDHVYPIHFIPANWFEMIGTSFTSNDLLKNPEDLSSDLLNYSLRRMQLCLYIQNALTFLKENKFLDNDLNRDLDIILNLQEELNTDEKKIFDKISKWIENNKLNIPASIDTLEKIIVPITDIHAATRGPKTTQASIYTKYIYTKYIYTKIIAKLTSKAKIKSILDKIDNTQKEHFLLQISKIARTRKKYIEKIIEFIKKIELKLNAKNPNLHLEHIFPIINQFKDINEKINIILNQIKQGILFQSIHVENATSKAPVPKGFVPISLKVKKNTYSSDVVFSAFGKKSISNRHEEIFKECTISISMNVAKIGIERDWFHPGIFALTQNMIKLGNVLISPKGDDYDGFDETRFNEMSKCIFPCYPTAMVIARDITITFEFNDNTVVLEAYDFIEKQALSSCVFLMFRNMLGNSTIQKSSSHVSSQNKSVIVKIDSTQLIGYCIEATRADKSTPIEVINKGYKDDETTQKKLPINSFMSSPPKATSSSAIKATNISSISEFVMNYKSLLEQNISNKKK